MKKLILSIAVIGFATISGFQRISVAKPKLFPEIEKYYAGLSSLQTKAGPIDGISYLSNYIRQATLSDKKIDMVFTCTDNAFRSVTAQIILQSLLTVNRISKLNVASCGFQSGEISPLLIQILAKHGFQVSHSTVGNNGNDSYEIKFGEGLSLTVFGKQASDPSIPKSEFLQIKLCSEDENSCSDLPGSRFKQGFPISPVSTATTEENADKVFTEIATDILVAFNKATN